MIIINTISNRLMKIFLCAVIKNLKKNLNTYLKFFHTSLVLEK